MTPLVPFGKYKGQPVENLIADRDYSDWLLAQPWVKERFGDIYMTVINMNGEPTETPDHNRLQAKFLDDEFCREIASVFDKNFSLTKQDANAMASDIGESFRGFSDWVEFEIRNTEFEYFGWDVRFDAVHGCEYETAYESWRTETKWFGARRSFLIECKPTIGDDYPAVLRQMKANFLALERIQRPRGMMVLVVGEYTGKGASFSEFGQIFRQSNIQVWKP